ncbi:GIY-YIG nuclease family protein [Peribacillus tepidiphilus]|jgi:putative endonuclease|uniref:GIY-YIG nuclease family protein n=1 Tax=Peribacillus tepidiphilus TaxID=2652445 RepID=UPI001291AB76|nr:GIY-YIG nuclease family protein [Peribacillus tepidiphilus]
MENVHYFYVLKCNDGTLYAGYTNCLEKRLRMHNEGKGAKYTRGRTPVTLVFQLEFTTKEAAMRAEFAFKQLPRRKKEAIIAKKECITFDLAAKEFC